MIEEPLTIACACKSELCGMTLTVLPVAVYLKLTMTPRVDDSQREPAIEWIRPEKLRRRLTSEQFQTFGVLFVRHFMDEDLDLDMLISDEDRKKLLELVGEGVTA